MHARLAVVVLALKQKLQGRFGRQSVMSGHALERLVLIFSERHVDQIDNDGGNLLHGL